MMQLQFMQSKLRRTLIGLFAAFWFGAGVQAVMAADDAIKLRANVALARDSNLFRLPAGLNPSAAYGLSSAQRGDSIRTQVLSVIFDKQVSRQALHLDAGVTKSKYSTYSFLDADSKSYNAYWDWQLGSQLSGRLSSDYRESLSSFAYLRSGVKNIETHRSHGATLDWRIGEGWRLVGDTARPSYENSLLASQNFQSKTDSTYLLWAPAPGNSVLMRVRRSNGEFRDQQLVGGVLVNNGYVQRETSLELTREISPRTRFKASAAQIHRDHANIPARNFSGTAADLAIDWQATGSLLLRVGASRGLSASYELLANYYTFRTVSFSPAWRVSDKVDCTLEVQRIDRDYAGDPGIIVTGAPKRQERVRKAGLNLNYAPARWATFSLGWQSEQRASNYTSQLYDDRTVTAGASFLFF